MPAVSLAPHHAWRHDEGSSSCFVPARRSLPNDHALTAPGFANFLFFAMALAQPDYLVPRPRREEACYRSVFAAKY